MRVVVNACTTIGNKTGIGRYTEELLRCFRDEMEFGELFAYPHGWIRGLRANWKRNTAQKPPSANSVACNRQSRWKSLSLRQATIALLRPVGHALLRTYESAVMRSGRFDLYHEPNYIPIPCDIPTITTIHDLSMLRHPEWHPKDRVERFEKCFAKGLRQARHFLTDTDYARREMVQYLGIPESKITAVYCGTRHDLAPMNARAVRRTLQRLGLPAHYLLHVGTIEPRKNLLRLLKAFVDLPSALRARHPLVLVGQWGWRYDETADFFHSTAKHKGVIQAGFIPDADLPAVYNGARALVFPTLYEGFGIPVVEMMSCGGAVLASTAGAVAEVAGGYADLIEPESVEDWRDAMYRVMTDDDWWMKLRSGVAGHARQFTWQRTAQETFSVYRQVLGLGQAEKFLPVPFSRRNPRSFAVPSIPVPVEAE